MSPGSGFSFEAAQVHLGSDVNGFMPRSSVMWLRPLSSALTMSQVRPGLGVSPVVVDSPKRRFNANVISQMLHVIDRSAQRCVFNDVH